MYSEKSQCKKQHFNFFKAINKTGLLTFRIYHQKLCSHSWLHPKSRLLYNTSVSVCISRCKYNCRHTVLKSTRQSTSSTSKRLTNYRWNISVLYFFAITLLKCDIPEEFLFGSIFLSTGILIPARKSFNIDSQLNYYSLISFSRTCREQMSREILFVWLVYGGDNELPSLCTFKFFDVTR